MPAIRSKKPGFVGNVQIRRDINTSLEKRRRRSYDDNRPRRSKRVLLESFITKNQKDIEILVAKALKNFKDENTRRELIEKLAVASGYVCSFNCKQVSLVSDKTRNLRQKLLRGEPDFSASPPSKWQDRENKNEKPTDFVRREYAKWIGKNLLQVHIRKYDMPLYYALANFQRRYGVNISRDLEIPSKKEATEVLLDEAGGVSDPTIEAAFRWKERLRTRQRRSQQRTLDH